MPKAKRIGDARRHNEAARLNTSDKRSIGVNQGRQPVNRGAIAACVEQKAGHVAEHDPRFWVIWDVADQRREVCIVTHIV